MKENFLSNVLNLIKSKEARGFVRKELESHLQKSKSHWIAKGLSEEEAEEKAVKQMGSPLELGKQFNKLHRPKTDWLLLSLFVIALGMGLLPLMNTGEVFVENLMMKQIVYIIIGAVIALTAMFFDYRKLRGLYWLFLGAGLFILLSLKVFNNPWINGAPFYPFFGFKINATTALPFLFLFWATYLSKKRPNIQWMIAAYLVTNWLFISMPALDIVIIYNILLFALLWGSSYNKRIISIVTALAACFAVIILLLIWFLGKEYQKQRLLGFLDPEKDPNGAGYIYLKIKESLISAGWFGNAGTEIILPEMHTDLAFINVTYFYGWLVAGALVLVLSLLAVRMLGITRKVKDRLGKQLVLGAIALFTTQFLYNIGMTLGFLPLASFSLPFISYGLTPAVLNSLIIGVVLSVYRRKDLVW